MKRYGLILLSLLIFLSGCGGEPSETISTTSASLVTTTASSETMLTEETTTVTQVVSDVTTTTKRKTTTTTSTTTTQKNATTQVVTTTTSQPIFITPSGEMRAAWVSYIELDGLLKSCKSAVQGKQAIDSILDTLEEFNLNTLFFHVRANSDAYYKSSYFKPAASVSKLISAGFDPLAYAVEAAHKRGIALHAWVNPYRAGKNVSYLVSGVPTLTDLSNRYYYVPTSSKSQQLILNGIRELVNHYAIDGVQYDDYFYPPDILETNTIYGYESADYETYKNNGGSLSVADWRRAAVDSLIAGTHTITKSKGRIFGVSPASNAQDTYDNLYANPKKWMAESGYIDYICPQIYTGFEHGGSPFDKMTDKWMSYPRHSSVQLYVGMAAYKAGLLNDTWAGKGKTEWAAHTDILKRSVLYLRSKGISGMAFYSYSYLKPEKVANLSSSNSVSVAVKEMDNLQTVL